MVMMFSIRAKTSVLLQGLSLLGLMAFAPQGCDAFVSIPPGQASSPRRHGASTQLAVLRDAMTSHQATGTVDIPILLETDRLLAINKPAGIPHDDSDELGILSQVRKAQEQGTFAYQGPIFGVHRLDRVTSGILLLAKDIDAAWELTNVFRESSRSRKRSVTDIHAGNKKTTISTDTGLIRYYTGISRNIPTRKLKGVVQGGMVRGQHNSWYLARAGGDQTKKLFAKTLFFTAGLDGLESCASPNPPRTLLLFRPYTWRTHQLRLAAKCLGLPLAGDPIYSDDFDENLSPPRTYLHATGLYLAPTGKASSALCDGLSIWCPPSSFEDLWEDESDKAAFRDILQELVKEHCEIKELRDLHQEDR